jgi:hypothetical protein
MRVSEHSIARESGIVDVGTPANGANFGAKSYTAISF